MFWSGSCVDFQNIWCIFNQLKTAIKSRSFNWIFIITSLFLWTNSISFESLLLYKKLCFVIYVYFVCCFSVFNAFLCCIYCIYCWVGWWWWNKNIMKNKVIQSIDLLNLSIIVHQISKRDEKLSVKHRKKLEIIKIRARILMEWN